LPERRQFWRIGSARRRDEVEAGIDVRITTSTSLVDFQRDKVDAGIRYGRGQWQGVRADRLMADELFPVCSPALLNGSKPLKCPEDLKDHVLLHTSNANSDDWRLWLTAAGLPADFSKQPGLTFDMIFMTVQAAIDGLGVAMGRTAYVEEDIAKGRLVVPFKIAFPVDAGFYLVSPTGRTDPPKLSAFRQWLLGSVQNHP
jgi:LysR family glycine cleavage system transcriptional activator